MKHIMVDLETLDTTPSAVVVSIGLVAFDPYMGITQDELYVIPSRLAQYEAGRTESESTRAWWLTQSIEARSVFDIQQEPVHSALDRVDAFFAEHPEAYLWGNGAAFDNVILADLYRSFGREAPWKFWKDCCFRTLKGLGANAGIAPPPFSGVAHNALDDAIHQARHMHCIVRDLQLRV